MAYHSISEKLRIFASRAFIIALVVILLIGESCWEKYKLMDTALFAAGCFFASIAALGRMWCALYIAGYKNNTLITAGPYSISRNPLYFFSLIGAIGVALATETLLIPAVVLIFFILYYPGVIRGEEKRLATAHGELFEAYRKRVPSFFPKFPLFQEPDTYVVNPKIFRKSIYSALWFIWLIAILDIIETLHETGILRVHFKIY
ncbi:MAG: isoprenylcysteine carboxylmethyltransferase family protein [Phycisphaerae bacterium]|jgi:protein-S-isoprenylcysteine O-methyltransferase Ste14